MLPHTYFCTCFIQTKKNKGGNNEGSTGLNIGNPKFYSLFLPDLIVIKKNLSRHYFGFSYKSDNLVIMYLPFAAIKLVFLKIEHLSFHESML